MNTLTEKAYRNLTTLLKMNTTDTFISRRGELLPQEDLVQVDNITDLEYAIYFTYHQLITSSDMGSFLNNGLIKQLDESIENMYDNEQFNELIEEKEFGKIVNDIDIKLDKLKERYYYQSPFFTFFKKIYNTYSYFRDIMVENNEHITKMLRTSLPNIHKDVNREYYSDDEEEKEKSGEEEDKSGDEEEEKEEEEKSGEEEEEEEEECVNGETGESNPNFSYDEGKSNIKNKDN